MYFKFVNKYQEISAGKSVPPASESKKVGRGKFPSHLPTGRWDRFLAGATAVQALLLREPEEPEEIRFIDPHLNLNSAFILSDRLGKERARA